MGKLLLLTLPRLPQPLGARTHAVLEANAAEASIPPPPSHREVEPQASSAGEVSREGTGGKKHSLLSLLTKKSGDVLPPREQDFSDITLAGDSGTDAACCASPSAHCAVAGGGRQGENASKPR